ncbi:MAG: class I SAM-dependent methyltransferase [Yoonia sp.]|nr:class I SAM-dependent methyltransferase [Yoonia sp.]
MPDEKTITFYDTAAERYANLTDTGTPSENLTAFMALLPKGGSVLDLGCGPARSSVHMREAGFKPDPVDASTGMIELANKTHNIGARFATFDDIDMVDAYDGVWANFSLLHAPLGDLPRYLLAISKALHSKGFFHIAMKVGAGAERDKIDRLYSYVSVSELRGLLKDAGFEVLDVVEGHEVGCAGTNDPFVVMRARKYA